MKTRAITGFFFVIVMLASVLLDNYVFGAFYLLLSAICLQEFYGLIKKSNSATPNLITGIMNHISCGAGYKGAFNNILYPGIKAKGDFFVKNEFDFDLDLYWFSRYPFDGLIFYPPIELRDMCWDVAISSNAYPEFEVEEIILLNYEYALKQYGTELRL